MTDAEFWRATPCQIFALHRELANLRKADRLHANFCAGLVASAIWNVNGGIEGEPVSPSRFMPEEKSAVPKEQTPEEMMAIAMAITIAHGGRVV